MKKVCLLLLLVIVSALAGCRTQTTTATLPAEDPIVGVWIIPQGENVPSYLTDLLDPWAIILTVTRPAADVVLVAQTPAFTDVDGGSLAFLNEHGDTIAGLFVQGTVRVAVGSTFAVAILRRNEAGTLYADEPEVHLFEAADDMAVIAVAQVLEAYGIAIRLTMVATPVLSDYRIQYFAGDGTRVGGTVLFLAGGGPWEYALDDSVAYVVVEETYADGDVVRRVLPREEGGSSELAVQHFTPFGYDEAATCTIQWSESPEVGE